jgi:CRP/FNR family cyclic AMP-dependent transcriptional regulator
VPPTGNDPLLGASTVIAWLVPAILVVLVAIAAWIGVRWIRSEHLETLRAVPLFSLLSESQLRAVLGSARAIGFPAGADFIQQGEQGKGLFVITDGTATVRLDGAELATLEPGSYVGEMAVIDGGPRTATVTAQTHVSTLEIGTAAFLRLLDREPMIARSVQEELVRRLKEAGSPVAEGTGTRVDRAELVELCQTLRRTRQSDWGEAPSTQRHRLWFSSLFARGS